MRCRSPGHRPGIGLLKDILTDDMFVGKQRVNFLQLLRRRAVGDLYLTCALCLLSEGQAAAAQFQQLLERGYERTEELIFVLSIAPDFEAAFDRLKPPIAPSAGYGPDHAGPGQRMDSELAAHEAAAAAENESGKGYGLVPYSVRAPHLICQAGEQILRLPAEKRVFATGDHICQYADGTVPDVSLVRCGKNPS